MDHHKSQSSLLRFRFTHHRGSRMTTIMEVARRGQYAPPPGKLEPGLWHQTTFPLTTKAQVQDALTLSELLLQHPRAEVYGNGHRINLHTVRSVLKCYEKSFGPSNWRAHCWIPKPAQFFEDWSVKIGQPIGLHMTLNPPEEQPFVSQIPDQRDPLPHRHRIWLFPCRIPAGADISRLHPSSLRDQVEASLTQYECAWCPRLRHLDDWDLNQWGPPEAEAQLQDRAD